MAKKHKRNTPHRATLLATDITTGAHTQLQDLASTPTSPLTKLRPVKWRPSLAHEKHKHDLDPSPFPSPTLSDRFNALPGEIREHIFSLLIVQPVKWDIRHRPECAYVPPPDGTPDPIPQMPCGANCARPYDENTWPEWWRNRHRKHWTPNLPEHDPWRSVWAPEQTNPYLCTTCFDGKFRPDRPKPTHLPCLCARRRNLEVRLVCKKWHAEASRIFYTRNVFAFEDSATFAAFVSHLPACLKTLIRHISLMAYLPSNNLTADPADFDPRPYRKTLPLLRQLPHLATLELDSLFLTSLKSLRPLRRLGLRSLRQCSFVQRLPDADFPRPDPFLHRGLARRALVRRFLAAEVAREVKGQGARKKGAKERWDRGGKKVVQAHVQWECEDRVWRDLIEQSGIEVARGEGWWVGVGNGTFWGGEEGVKASNLWGRWGGRWALPSQG